jgi:uncharacterized membrane protein
MEHQVQTTADSIIIENALLKNNAVIFERMDKAIEQNGAKITKSFDDKTDGYVNQLTTLAKETGTLSNRMDQQERNFIDLDTKVTDKVNSISTKVATVGAIVAVIFTVIGYFIGNGHVR